MKQPKFKVYIVEMALPTGIGTIHIIAVNRKEAANRAMQLISKDKKLKKLNIKIRVT